MAMVKGPKEKKEEKSLFLPVRSETGAGERSSGAPMPSKAQKDRREVASSKPPGSTGPAAGEVGEEEEAKRAAAEEEEGALPRQRLRSEKAQTRSGPSKSKEVLGVPHSRATGEAAAAWL